MTRYGVYTGRWTWTDYSKGQIMGDQVTLTSDSSNILIAAIAVLNTLVGSIAWSLLSFTFHQLRSNRSQIKDGLFHQTQILLRNCDTATAFATEILHLGWSWRKRFPKNALFRTLTLAVPALFIFVTFLLAGLLLSQLATKGDVRLVPISCGGIETSTMAKLSPKEQYELVMAIDVWGTQDTFLANAYAESCYRNVEHSTAASTSANVPASDCDFYVKATLSWTTRYPNECPFENGLCSVADSEVIELDTGLLDSHEDFGLNAEKSNRIHYRKKMTCSPLSTIGRTRFHKGRNVMAYYYGYNAQQSPAGKIVPNATFVATLQSEDTYAQAYQLLVASEGAAGGGTKDQSLFTRDNNVYKGEGVVTLLFLENRAIYPNGYVDDPWFNATKPDVHAPPGVHEYRAASPGQVLGCIENSYICNPNNDLCMSMNDWNSHKGWYNVSAIKPNPVQYATAENIIGSTGQTNLGILSETLGANILAANDYLTAQTSTVSMPLHSNQWQREVQRFMAVAMASIQRNQVTGIGGAPDPLVDKYTSPATGSARYLCENQKFRSNEHSSFSVLGLALVFTFDGLIILSAGIVKYVLPYVRRGTASGTRRRESWIADGVLQLHKVLYESLDIVSWLVGPGRLPITTGTEKFAGLVDLNLNPLKTDHYSSQSLTSQKPPTIEVHFPDSSLDNTPVETNIDWKRSSRISVNLVESINGRSETMDG